MLIPLEHGEVAGRGAMESLCPALPIPPESPRDAKAGPEAGGRSAGRSSLSLALNFFQNIVQFRHKAGAQ